MAEKTLKSRIIHKHDTAANWLKATTFVPKQGEIIVYDIDANYSYERFKIGDGKTTVNSLPFAGGDIAANTLESAKAYTDAEIAEWVGDKTVSVQVQTAMATKADVGHVHDDKYYTKSEVNTKLDGKSDKSHTHDLSKESVNYAATAGVASSVEWLNVQNRPDTYTPATHKHTTNDITDLQGKLDAKVPTSRQVNNKQLTGDITLSASDVGADTAGSASTALTNAKTYTNQQITSWVGDKTVAVQIDEAIDDAMEYVEGQMIEPVFYVTFTKQSNGKYTADKTYADVSAAYAADQTVMGLLNLGTGTIYHIPVLYFDANYGIVFHTSLESSEPITIGYGKDGTIVSSVYDKLASTKDISDAISKITHPVTSVNGQTGKVTLTASSVGADAAGSATSALNSAKSYTDTKISSMVGDTTVSTQITNALASKADSNHNHDDIYYTETEMNSKLNAKLSLSGGTLTGNLTMDNSATSQSGEPHIQWATISGNKPYTGFAHDQSDGTFIICSMEKDTTTNGVKYYKNGLAIGGGSGNLFWKGSKIVTVSDEASTSAAGLMSAADKTKLNGIATGATKVTVDSALSSTSTNPVQNKIINAAITDLKSKVGDTAVSTQISNAIASKADSSHEHSSYVNQNAFSNVKVGSTTVAADSATDTLTLAGDNVTITPDATNDKITIGITKANVTTALGYTPPTKDTTYEAAGSSLGLVKSGGDVTISDGVIAVNDDSHNHVTSNIDGLDAKLSLIGDTAVSTQIANAIASKSDTGHTHDDRYYTESEINTKLNAKADSSHGNHVPTTETANNAKFLRNDNTWQTVTPDNIGAAKASHGTHVSYSSTAPVMDGTASAGSASTVARSDHKHPTDTSRASVSSVTALQNLVGDTTVQTQIQNALSSQKHVIADISNIVISATQPSSPTAGMLWFDIS